MRLAMWSGPRNLSTAMMYAFSRRADCSVWDEPFYAAYLASTGLGHPMRDDIISAGITDSGQVVSDCLGGIPGGRELFYQKHMAHHMLPGFDRGWMREMVNVFLIRHPARVVASYAAKRESPDLDDLGFRQQWDLVQHVASMGQAPVIIDSADIRADPARALARLCGAVGLAYDPAMLHWPTGGIAQDGVWAAHWYGAVHRSSGFAGAEGPLPALPVAYERLAEAAMPFYRRMAEA